MEGNGGLTGGDGFDVALGLFTVNNNTIKAEQVSGLHPYDGNYIDDASHLMCDITGNAGEYGKRFGNFIYGSTGNAV